MRYLVPQHNLELWVSDIATPSGFEWSVIQWGADGSKLYDVGGHGKTNMEANDIAYVNLAFRRTELLKWKA